MILPSKGVIGVVSLALSLALLSTPTHAQDHITTVSDPGYVRFQDKFYVVGGGLIREVQERGHFTTPKGTIGDGQFAVLDLSVPWKGISPAWKKLPNGPKQNGAPVAMNREGTKLINFMIPGNSSADPFAQIFDIASNTWMPSKIHVASPNRNGLRAITSPDNGYTYIAGGYEADDKMDQMYVYHWDTDELTKIGMGSGAMVNTQHYRAVWWTTKKSILYFGGFASGQFARADVNVFDTATEGFTSLQTTGEAPGPRSDMCMAISEDGTKLVVFGGRYYDMWKQWIQNSLYILDLNTMVWTRAQDYATPRTYAACTIADDTFISWGGTDTVTTVNSPAIIYDLKRNKYLSQFKGPDPDNDIDPLMKNIPPPKSNGNGGSSSSGGGLTFEQHRNLVLGCVFGSVALIWLVGCCCLCRVRKRRALNVQLVLEESNRKIAESQKTTAPATTNAARASTVAGARNTVKNNNSNNRTSTTVRPAALTSPVQPPGIQTYPVMQSSGSQPYPLLQTGQGQQVYAPFPQQQQGYPMVPLQYQQHQHGQGSPQFYPVLQQQEQHRLSKAGVPLPHQPGGSPQVITNQTYSKDDGSSGSVSIASPPLPMYASPYIPSVPRGPELVSSAHSEYAESNGFAGSQASFGQQTPASGSAADLLRSPQMR
ncbi:kelch domain containing 4 [Mortierella sp. 14UC]|nr:kelch domain containing 4 [Mortierella sp. 14UC]